MTRRWSHAPRLRRGELLSSALIRAARQHGHTPWRFAELNWPGNRVWTRDVDLYPAVEVVDAWRDRGGAERTDVMLATLEREREVLGGFRNGAPFITALGIWHTRRRRHGLAFCPDCLAEFPGIWWKTWRYAFTVCCPRHGRVLFDACPICDAPLAPHRNLDPVLDRCDQCRADLRVCKDIAQADDETAALQEHLTCAIGARMASAQQNRATVSTDRVAPSLEDYRAMLAVAAHPGFRRLMGDALSVPLQPRIEGTSTVFERARLRWRAESLLLVVRWSADWPGGFLRVCRQVGLTQRAFARALPGPAVLDAIQGLPERRRPHQMRRPLIHDAETRRARKRNPAAYRERRADLLLRHASTWAPTS